MRCKSRTRPGLEVQKNRTEGSNLSPSATQSEVQRNPPGLLLKLREMGAIPHLLLSRWTGESVLLIAAGKLCSLFLRRAYEQSGFNNSVRRMQCDHKPIGKRFANLALMVRLGLWRGTLRIESFPQCGCGWQTVRSAQDENRSNKVASTPDGFTMGAVFDVKKEILIYARRVGLHLMACVVA